MRLWSLHPRYLDVAGLVACWREALLAQAVLAGRTTGYTSHPQLKRFRATGFPLSAVAFYLHGLADEADARKYVFDRGRIDLGLVTLADGPSPVLPVTVGQLRYERLHLLGKLRVRSPGSVARLRCVPAAAVPPHPSFYTVPGDVEPWEKRKSKSSRR